MGAAIAHWHWTPAQFWGATNSEYQAAQEAVARANDAADRARGGVVGQRGGAK